MSPPRRSRSIGLAAAVAAMLGALAVPAAAGPSGGAQVDVIVALEDAFAPGGHEANRAEAARIAREHGVTPTQTYGTALFGFAASVPESRLNGLRNDPRVDYVDRDAPVEAYAGEVKPWGLSRIGAPLSDNTGVGIHVYVLDTGIDSDHADLAVSPEGHAVEECKGGTCLQKWDDDHGHGTHVAGTVAALDNDIDVVGVAPAATLHAVKVLSKSGSGSRSGVIAGIDWVTNHVTTNGLGGKAVINMSLGGSGSKSGECADTLRTAGDPSSAFTGSDSYHQSICTSRHSGVVFAVAAGNSSADAEDAVPAAYDDAVITVSATTCTTSNNVCEVGTDDWPYWSNWGDNSASWTPHGSAPVAIAAPGRYVLSTAMGGGTTTKSGTSMAAPHVAGAVALWLKANAQNADGSAFSNARAGLMSLDESTDSFKNTSGYVHNEDFLDVRSLGTATSTTLAVSAVSASPNPFSPNADGTKDSTTVSFTFNKEATWSATVADTNGTLCTASSGTTAAAKSGSFVWDGSTGGGLCNADTATKAGTGSYTVTITATAGSETANGTATVGVDVTAPTIASVAATNVTSSSADIGWTTTGDPSTSVVRYWVGTGTKTEVADSTLVETHAVSLTGLAAETTYNYEVESVDAAGNKSVATGSPFTTAAASSSALYVTTPSGTTGYDTTGGKNNKLHLLVTVSLNSLADGSGSPVDGTVYVEICYSQTSKTDGGTCTSSTTATGSASTSGGSVTFKWTNAPSGYYYRTTVTKVVTLDGVTHTPATPDNEFYKGF